MTQRGDTLRQIRTAPHPYSAGRVPRAQFGFDQARGRPTGGANEYLGHRPMVAPKRNCPTRGQSSCRCLMTSTSAPFMAPQGQWQAVELRSRARWLGRRGNHRPDTAASVSGMPAMRGREIPTPSGSEAGYIHPRSARLAVPSAPTTIWSRSRTSTSSSACLMRVVMARSAAEGSGLPEG